VPSLKGSRGARAVVTVMDGSFLDPSPKILALLLREC